LLLFGVEAEDLLPLYSRRSGTSACSSIICDHFLKWSALFGNEPGMYSLLSYTYDEGGAVFGL